MSFHPKRGVIPQKWGTGDANDHCAAAADKEEGKGERRKRQVKGEV
jgi:hypothetical protein